LPRDDRLELTVQGKWAFPSAPLFGQFPTRYKSSAPRGCVVHTSDLDAADLLIGRRRVAATKARPVG
jgi:hypothetical protein